MFAAFHNAALIDDQNLVGVLNGTEPVGYYEGGAVGHQAGEGFLYQLFGFGIEGRRRFIQN